jgi:DNA-binding response OmpR family regulator
VTSEIAGVAALRAAHPRMPIMVVGIRRGLVAAALDAGADAVLAGPPRPDELRARLRAIARRREPAVRVGPLEIHHAARVARLDGSALALGRREYDLLACLASSPGSVFTKDGLLRRCWPPNAYDPTGRALERCASRLRRRLGRHGSMLVTVRGIGYRLGGPDGLETVHARSSSASQPAPMSLRSPEGNPLTLGGSATSCPPPSGRCWAALENLVGD